MDTLTLTDLGQQIEQLEGQLTSMRGEFETRKEDLGHLQKRKEQLQATLRQVELEIASLVGEVSAQAGKIKMPSMTNSTAVKPAKKKTGKKGPGKKGPKAKTAASAARTVNQKSLREVVTEILKSARKPLKTKELADRALAAGYATKSTNFPAVVQDLIRKMDNLERVKNQGYQLKR